MESIQLIHADTSHTSLLAKLALDTFCESFEKVNNPNDFKAYTSEAFREDLIEKEIGEPGSQYILAYMDNELAGYARVRQSNEVKDEFPGKNTIELQRIYALQKFIGRGVGKTLMNYCLALAKEKGAKIIWLGVWEQNTRAISFYKQWGFELFGSHVFMLGKDQQTDLLMKKELK